ncbi:universal stress protein [Desulfosarcina sp. OttesenSCG-928-A07]|nr:universal stress protein [Desulfosarcina sp. OttesenSCG-928-G17]MDL2329597.1 universal stress protein [Desulfosarcina sp. OttesenSCG-928-A07]
MSLNHIVCCTDFSENSELTFQAALEMAERYQAKLYVLHVMPPVINPVMAETSLVISPLADEALVVGLNARMQEVYEKRIPTVLDFELVVRDGHVSTEIINFAEEVDADLVMVGAFGLSGMGLVLFGSVAKRVAHKCPCSVMIVR